MAECSSPQPTPPVVDDARADAPAHTTAYKLGKRYLANGTFRANDGPRTAQPDDGHISSHRYAAESQQLQQDHAGGNGAPRRAAARFLDIDFHHPLEDWLGRYAVRKLLAFLTRRRPGRKTIIEEMLASYGDPHAPLAQRVLYWPVHKVIDRLRGSAPVATIRERVCEHRPTIRGLVLTARSVAEFGLTVPQRYSAPMFVVWNFTNRCNLSCKHCYQDASHQALADELTLPEKLDLIEQIAAEHVPMIAFAGGEPTISPDLLPVLRRCKRHGLHTSLATNGSMMTPKLAAELADAGARYVEISLDSVHPEKHDAFRGQPGMWHRTVRAMRTVAQTPGLRLGVAMCVTQGNFDEVEDMLQFAVDIGATCIAHFNFIPVGRGLEMAAGDLTPRQREWLLRTFNEWMQSGRIGVISTAPQLGRLSLAFSTGQGRQSCSHAGSAAGWKARVVAKYLGGCGAGRTYACIEPNGDVTPCVYLPHRVLGSVRQRRFADIFRNNPFWDLLCDRTKLTHHCAVCAFRNYCGGCRARADAYFGALNAGDPGCLFNEKHWEALVAQGAATEPATPESRQCVKTYDGCATSWVAQ